MPPANFEPNSESETVVFDLCTFCSMVYQKTLPPYSHQSVDNENEYRRLRMEFVLAKEIDPTNASKCCDRCWGAFDAFCDFKMRCDAALVAADESSKNAAHGRRPEVNLIVKASAPGQEQVCFEVTELQTDPSLEHPTETKYECDICGKRYQYQGSLTFHAAKHGDPQFSCGICGKAFYHR